MLNRTNSFHYDCVSEVDRQIKELVLTPFLLYRITEICFEHERLQNGEDDFWVDNNYSFFGAVIELFGEDHLLPF